jgi:hypothetical protein
MSKVFVAVLVVIVVVDVVILYLGMGGNFRLFLWPDEASFGLVSPDQKAYIVYAYPTICNKFVTNGNVLQKTTQHVVVPLYP